MNRSTTVEAVFGKQNATRYVVIPTLSGVQASKLLGWVYKRDAGWRNTHRVNLRSPYEALIEHAAGKCACHEIAKEQQEAMEEYAYKLAHYERSLQINREAASAH